jgi:PBSX family phage portal protein
MTGKIQKVFVLDQGGQQIGPAISPSKQIDPDSFSNAYTVLQLVEPPVSMEQLVALEELHPVHGACVKQKVTDVVGSGWEWVTDETDLLFTPDETWDEFADEGISMHETIAAVYDDFANTNNGYIEVSRTAEGKPANLYHVPSRSVRIHISKEKFAQESISGQRVWFKRWGIKGDILKDSGATAPPGTPGDQLANDLIWITATNGKSVYGTPEWVAAVGWLMLALAVRDYNLLFFRNNREPRWVVILSDIDTDDGIQQAIQQAFAVDLQQPHKNLIIPVEGGGKITFQRLSDTASEASFLKLLEVCDTEILVSHRLPPERIGLARVGPLGGNVAFASNKIYREGVVRPAQRLLESRLNNFLQTEMPDIFGNWVIHFKEMDLAEEELDLASAVNAFRNYIVTLDEARIKAGWEPLDPDLYKDIGQQFLFQLQPGGAGGVQALAANDQMARENHLANMLQSVNSGVMSLLTSPSPDLSVLEIPGPPNPSQAASQTHPAPNPTGG